MQNEVQLARERVQSHWELEKRRLEEFKVQMREKVTQLQDLEEKHAFELSIYKHKVQHLLQNLQSQMADLKLDEQIAAQQLASEQRRVQHQVRQSIRGVHVRLKELESTTGDVARSLRQEQEKAIMELRQEYERRGEELKAGFRKRQKTLRKKFQEQRKFEVRRIEAKKDQRIAELTAKHKQAFYNIKNYYRDITHNNLDLIKSLKEEANELKKKEQAELKDMSEINAANRKLSEPLHRNLVLIEQLKRDLQVNEQEKAALAATKDRVSEVELRLQSLGWDHELLVQRHEQLAAERDELRAALDSHIFAAQQECGFEQLVLSRQVAAVAEDIEKAESVLSDALKSCNLRPEVIGDIQRNLADVLALKDRLQRELEERLSDLRAHYYDTVQGYEAKLEEFGVPAAELGFTPAAF